MTNAERFFALVGAIIGAVALLYLMTFGLWVMFHCIYESQQPKWTDWPPHTEYCEWAAEYNLQHDIHGAEYMLWVGEEEKADRWGGRIVEARRMSGYEGLAIDACPDNVEVNP